MDLKGHVIVVYRFFIQEFVFFYRCIYTTYMEQWKMTSIGEDRKGRK